jgi:hypothetical protein
MFPFRADLIPQALTFSVPARHVVNIVYLPVIPGLDPGTSFQELSG